MCTASYPPILLQAYASDPSWAAKGPALLTPPQLAGGRLVIELTSLKEAPKSVENFRCLCTGEKGTGKASGKPLHYKGVRLHRIQKGAVRAAGHWCAGRVVLACASACSWLPSRPSLEYHPYLLQGLWCRVVMW